MHIWLAIELTGCRILKICNVDAYSRYTDTMVKDIILVQMGDICESKAGVAGSITIVCYFFQTASLPTQSLNY